MSMTEVTHKVDDLGRAWEQFKAVNNRRLAEIEKKGGADSLTTEQLNCINHAMDEYKDRIGTLETALLRPGKDESISHSNSHVSEHKAAFCGYLRKGVDSNLSTLETKALSVGSDADGGYLVTSHMSDRIVKTVFETSAMRKIAAVETISTDALEVIQDNDEAAVGWTTETGAVSDSDTPQIAKKVIDVHELYAQPKATQKLIDDASIDIELWLADKLADAFSRKENTAFISGDGSGKPKGILSYAAGTAWGEIEQINSGSAGAITADGLVNLFFALKEEYAARATFLMNRAAVKQARLLKEATTNQYLWQPGLAAGAPDTLMGVPVMQAADMPVPAANSLSVAVGDFSRAYQIVDRTGIRVLRDPFTDKPFVKFYSTKRVGGDVVNFEAIKLLKLAA